MEKFVICRCSLGICGEQPYGMKKFVIRRYPLVGMIRHKLGHAPTEWEKFTVRRCPRLERADTNLNIPLRYGKNLLFVGVLCLE